MERTEDEEIQLETKIKDKHYIIKRNGMDDTKGR